MPSAVRRCSDEKNSRGETVVIFASPRRNGFTGRLLDAFLKKNSIGEYYFFDCFKEKPIPCDDCGRCKTAFGCSKDDLAEFYKHFDRCDRLIIASPVYNGGFPAYLKALMDRSQMYYNAHFLRGERPAGTVPKKAAVLLTAGAKADTRHMITALRRIFSVTSCALSAEFVLTGTDNAEPIIDEKGLPEI